MGGPLLEVQGLRTYFYMRGGVMRAVDGAHDAASHVKVGPETLNLEQWPSHCAARLTGPGDPWETVRCQPASHQSARFQVLPAGEGLSTKLRSAGDATPTSTRRYNGSSQRALAYAAWKSR